MKLITENQKPRELKDLISDDIKRLLSSTNSSDIQLGMCLLLTSNFLPPPCDSRFKVMELRDKNFSNLAAVVHKEKGCAMWEAYDTIYFVNGFSKDYRYFLEAKNNTSWNILYI